jgi:hypothetical protein
MLVNLKNNCCYDYMSVSFNQKEKKAERASAEMTTHIVITSSTATIPLIYAVNHSRRISDKIMTFSK